MSDNNIISKNLLTYKSVTDDRSNFIKSGTRNGSDFNFYDTPSNKYFKILFHFYNSDVDNNTDSPTGLLGPAWQYCNNDEWYNYNTAYSYLMLNNEVERADLLKDFINLLSSINCESPWYFKEISGIDAALERKTTDMKIEDRKKITIKCLHDSYDDRIATLLDLYRAVVWSWKMKREVIPSNLRKFDMSIYIFDTPTVPFHYYHSTIELPIPFLNQDKYAKFSGNDSSYQTSFKHIEFHNCEIEYNSAKSPYGTMSNETGLQPEYSIDIYFDDCYETRYNEFMMKEIGDMILWDIATSNMLDDGSIRTKYDKSSVNMNELENRISHYDGGFITNAVDQLLSTGMNWVESKVKRAVLGNLYTYSLMKIGSQISSLMQGNVLGAAGNIREYIDEKNQREGTGIHAVDASVGGNMFKDSEKMQVNQFVSNNIFPPKMGSNDTSVEGNMFEDSENTQVDQFVSNNIFPPKIDRNYKPSGNIFVKKSSELALANTLVHSI